MPVFSMTGPTRTWKAWSSESALATAPDTTALATYVAASPAEALTVDFFFVGFLFDRWDLAASFKSAIDDLYDLFEANGKQPPIVVGHIRADVYGIKDEDDAGDHPTFGDISERPSGAMFANPILDTTTLSAEDLSWSDCVTALGYTFPNVTGETAVCPKTVTIDRSGETIDFRSNIMDVSNTSWLGLHHEYGALTRAYMWPNSRSLLRIETKEYYYHNGECLSTLPTDPVTYFNHKTGAVDETAGGTRCLAAWIYNDWDDVAPAPEWDGESGWQLDFPDVTWIQWVNGMTEYANEAGTAGNPVWYDFPLDKVWVLNRYSWHMDPEWDGDPYDGNQDYDSEYNVGVRKAMSLARATAIRDACRNLPEGSVIVIPTSSTIYGITDTGTGAAAVPIIELFTDEDWGAQGKWLIQKDGTTYTVLQEREHYGPCPLALSLAVAY